MNRAKEREAGWYDDLAEEQMVDEPVNDPEVDLPGDGGDPVRSRWAGPWWAADDGEELAMGMHESGLVHEGGAVDAWLEEAELEEVRYCDRYRKKLAHGSERHRRELPVGVDAGDLAQAGWGVILSRKAPPGVREALAPLLRLRRQQAGRHFKELEYQLGDSARRFLEVRYHQAPGVIDPSKVPYYLLIVGGPNEVPFSFQYQLGVSHAIGRVSFDRLQQYRRYAEAAASAEWACPSGRPLTSGQRSVTFFAPRRPGDVALDRISHHLVEPLVTLLREDEPEWRVTTWTGSQATKGRLAELLGGAATPQVLLVGCHGLATDMSEESVRYQGALICGDSHDAEGWVDPARCFSAEDLKDLSPDALYGSTVFLLACYGAGTPAVDSFPVRIVDQGRRRLAERPTLAPLPAGLLNRGALAVIGHVDRGWTLAFSWLLGDKVREAAGTYEKVFAQLLAGERAGHALRPFSRRFASIAAHAAPLLEHALEGGEVDRRQLRLLRIAMHDARNVVLMGDPAVRAAATSEPPALAPA